ncbi:MAG: hypothetical protein WC560_02390 [Syntrophales bacterium]
MTQTEKVKCQKCGDEISPDDSLNLGELVVCEDCYIMATQRVQTCDPFAVRSATQYRKASGLEATEGLTELQKSICEFVNSKGKTTAAELTDTFHLSPSRTGESDSYPETLRTGKGAKRGGHSLCDPFLISKSNSLLH